MQVFIPVYMEDCLVACLVVMPAIVMALIIYVSGEVIIFIFK